MMLEDLYRLLRTGHVQAQGVVDTMTQPIVVLDQNLCIATANNAFLKTFEVERDDILGESFFDLGNGQWDITELRQLIAAVIPKAATVIGYEVAHDFPTIGRRTFHVDARRLVHPDDNSTNILVLFDDVTEMQRHEAEKDFIISETRHRMKNLFAVVRSLAMQMDAEDLTGVDYRARFLGRLEVTLHAQEIAAINETTDFETLLRQSVSEPGTDRLHCRGPIVQVQGSEIVPVSMMFHELATNALKYGALSVPEGALHVEWSLEERPENRSYFVCRWRETAGPAIEPPKRRGYGTELIEGTCRHLGGTVELNFDPKGLTAIIKLPWKLS
ncbi:PAS domain-containing protein [Rhizobium sp. AB2/73]|uniref:PAS domain-containing protein n=1 Tax=Rhizobium sp. AB2/73 TaxID=2795216 RepID=UPI000DDD8524|nr:PAS domain-containing protein [Rhizobium sp. AB2/73]QYA16400.1 PAS domain-containing protein [Rhizobium sp. AB2/73]UEQ84943.1 PAS domain-containing protein [Rhizobium sp. AB2/73]